MNYRVLNNLRQPVEIHLDSGEVLVMEPSGELNIPEAARASTHLAALEQQNAVKVLEAPEEPTPEGAAEEPAEKADAVRKTREKRK